MKYVCPGLLIWGTVLCFVGCQPSSSSDNWLLVSFEKDVPITYKMVTERTTQIDLTNTDSRPQTMNEKLELVMVYSPIEVDPFGVTTLKVDCQSVNTRRTGFSGSRQAKDVIENLAGKSFILKVSPTGLVVDNADLERIATELADGSFDSSRGLRIKNPEMISDFLAMQQFLWDASSTISNQMNLKVGDTWQTHQLISWPAPKYPPPSRMTTFTLDSISEEAPRKASITSTYEISEEPIETYVRPYSEELFQMRGLFGFLRNYQFKQIEGSGKQVFNLDDGLVESDQQQYTLNVTASFMLPLGDSVPVLTVDQTVSIERIQTTE